MGLARLGKRKHTVLRDSRLGVESDTNARGSYVDGEWVEAERYELQLTMNVQANFSSFLTKTLPQGDREKEAVWFSSDDWIYQAETGSNPHEGDIIFYRGMYWEVRVSQPYGNFGTHCEGIAVKINKQTQAKKLEGAVGVIRESDY